LSFETYRRLLTPIVRTVYRLEVRGQEHMPPVGAVVVAANHDSVLDPFVLAAAISRPTRYLGKAELWRVPLLGSWLVSIDAIPVERGRSDAGAIESALAALEAGEVVGIFPEGGVKREGPWLRGAARMALATGAPLLPVRLLETRSAIGRGQVAFPRLAVLIGEPIVVERVEPTVELARVLTDQLQAAVEALGT
jgi:1-acyl-sn-glycerol-3-phosphate acyltransferase